MRKNKKMVPGLGIEPMIMILFYLVDLYVFICIFGE